MTNWETGRPADVPLKMIESARSADDVAEIVHLMHADLSANPTAWENPTLDRFLDALGGYLRDAGEERYADVPAAAWAALADILYAASLYE